MIHEHEGSLDGQGLRIAIIAAQFNEHISNLLVDGAKSALGEHGVRDEDTLIAKVPGSFELPLVADKLARTGQWDAIVCVGAIVRGETAHFDHISRTATDGLSEISRQTGVPVILGILTTYNVEQAMERAGGRIGNNGYNVTESAIRMVNLLKQLKLANPRGVAIPR